MEAWGNATEDQSTVALSSHITRPLKRDIDGSLRTVKKIYCIITYANHFAPQSAKRELAEVAAFRKWGSTAVWRRYRPEASDKRLDSGKEVSAKLSQTQHHTLD